VTTIDEGLAPVGQSTTRKRPLAGPIVLATGALATCAYVYASNPDNGGTFLPCPFHQMTGLWCPGCGLTRATHHLLHGDLAGALSRNLFLPFIVVMAVWSWVTWVQHRLGRPSRGPDAIPKQAWILIGVAVLAFGVVRNLPFGAALAP
jgi:hypothetical protein